jgi:protein involved in sex pheromone biosynthesis
MGCERIMAHKRKNSMRTMKRFSNTMEQYFRKMHGRTIGKMRYMLRKMKKR